MIGELNKAVSGALDGVTAKRSAKEQYLRAVDARAAETVRVGLGLLMGVIPSVIAENNTIEADLRRRAARYYTAGILHMAGFPTDRGMGDVDTHPVTLARGVVSNGYRYARVSAEIVGACTGPISTDDVDPRALDPDQITEASYHTHADREEGGRDRVSRSGAWLGVANMPSEYSERPHYTRPERLEELTQQMLASMRDPGLNPELQTHAHLATLSPELAEQVSDVDRPLSEIQFNLVLPVWAKARVGAG